MNIDAASQEALLSLARSAIASSLGVPGGTPAMRLAIFDRRQGVFVTLTLRARLRGCIGRVDPTDPLRVMIPEVARSAAFSDPRFPPLAVDELGHVRIEISLLSVPERVISPEDVVVGRHGVIVECQRRRGLLLPQVAVEYAWERDEFLAHVCDKASLPPDAWRRKDVGLLRFEAQVFAETLAG